MPGQNIKNYYFNRFDAKLNIFHQDYIHNTFYFYIDYKNNYSIGISLSGGLFGLI